MAYTYEVDKDRLSRAVLAGFEHLDWRRECRTKLLKHIAGSMYVKGWDTAKQPLNLLNQTLFTLTANIISGKARFVCKSDVPSIMPSARVFGKVVERTWWANRYKDTTRMCLIDAMVGLGCCKVGVADEENTPDYMGYPSPGSVFYDRVDLDDLTIDPNARGLSRWSFCGNKYCLPLEVAQNIRGIDPDKVAKLSETVENADRNIAARIGNRDVDAKDSQLTDYVSMVDVFIPHHQIIVTLGYGKSSGGVEVLMTKEWKGPKCGPYRFLQFQDLPNNVFPIPPLQIVFDLHEATNQHFRKFIAQVLRAKTLYGYAPGSDDDAVTVQKAQDGAIVQMEDPKSVAAIEYQGPSPTMYQESAFMQNMFSKHADNIDLTAGVGAGAKTLGQSQILMGNINQRMTAYRERLNEFMARCGEDAAYYLHNDPIIDETLSIEDQMGNPLEVYYNPQVRQGDVYQYQFECEAFQEPYTDSQTEFGRLMQFLAEGIPMAYQAEQISQYAVNAAILIRNMARKMNISGEIAEAFRDQETMTRMVLEHRATMMQQQQAEAMNSLGGPATSSSPSRPQQPGGRMDRKTNSSPQMAGGMRDSGTVANGKYSSQAMSGSTLGAATAGRQRY